MKVNIEIDCSPEEARRMMEAFHRGTRRGRDSDPTRFSETATE